MVVILIYRTVSIVKCMFPVCVFSIIVYLVKQNSNSIIYFVSSNWMMRGLPHWTPLPAGYNFYQSDAGSKVLLEFFGLSEPTDAPKGSRRPSESGPLRIDVLKPSVEVEDVVV